MDKKYICNINLRDTQHKDILAGTIFYKEALVLATFDTLIEQGHITEVIEGRPTPPVIVPQDDKRALAVGLTNKTPTAAIHPPKRSTNGRKAPERLNPQQLKRKEELRIKIGSVTGKLPPSNCRLDTLESKWVGIVKDTKKESFKEEPKKIDTEKQEAETKMIATCVWDGNPEVLGGATFEQLLSVYKERCAQYDIGMETFDTKELLIEKLSSQFKSK